MVGLLFAIPILLFFLYVKKREPTQSEMGFWLLFLLPFGLMAALWVEGEDTQKFWWAYLFLWLLAGGILFENMLKKNK